MNTTIVALAINMAVASLASAQSSVQTPAAPSCKPTIEAAKYVRGVPWTYVEQGLQSIPLLYPSHGPVLAERRDAQLGQVTFSLLVYQQDIAKPEVTIEGMALEGQPDDLRAWHFASRCPAEKLADGLVTTLEVVAKLSKNP